MWLGYAALVLGTVAAVAAAGLAVRTRSRQADTSQGQVVADVQATISRLSSESTPPPKVTDELAEWEQHAATAARRQLDMLLKHSTEALRQGELSFRLGMSAAVLGFLAILGSLAWLIAADRNVAWLGVISGGVCEAVAALFFVETRATRARTAAMLDRAQAEADRVVRARGAMAVVQSISDPKVKEALLADIGRWLLGAADGPAQAPHTTT
jgi:hypothetical protein